MITPPTFPARPVHGGKLHLVPAKTGQWGYELKWNGWRAAVHAPTGTMFNRHNKELSIAGDFKEALADLRFLAASTNQEWWDCEALERRHKFAQGTLIVLDVLIPEASYFARRSLIDRCVPQIEDVGAVPANRLLCGPAIMDGMMLWDQCAEINARCPEFVEGVVAKRLDSSYPYQLRSDKQEFPYWVKHRIK